MGFLSGIGKASHSPDFGMRLQAALAAAGGDQNAIYRMREMQRQNAELQLRQQAAQRAEEDRNNQVWGLKESGFSNPEIAAMNAGDASQATRERFAPYQLAPGSSRHIPGVGGQPEQVVNAPTTEEQQAAFYDRTSPGMGAAFARRQALGPPVPIQQGGGLAVPQADGSWGWGVAPEGVQPAPSGPAAPSGGGSARNNPGGLRYPGSTQFRSFPTQQAGVAAQDQQLGLYFQRGINTVRGIVETWAPRRSRGGDNSDASVDNYIAHVARRLGVSPDQPLGANAIPSIRQAQDEFETGHRGRGTIPGAGNPGRAAALRAEAQRAIAAGADPAAVQARLRQMGVN